jgi:hypothetical protein
MFRAANNESTLGSEVMLKLSGCCGRMMQSRSEVVHVHPYRYQLPAIIII